MAVDSNQLYPLSTPAGEAIPLEVWRPNGLIRIDTDDAASADVAIPTTAELLCFYSDVDCIVRFGETNAAVPADLAHVADSFLLPAGVFRTIDPNGATEVSTIGVNAGDTGTVWIDCSKRWADIRKAAQVTRG